MGKDFNSRNDVGVSAPPVDGPGSAYSAKVFPGPTYSLSNFDSPHSAAEETLPSKNTPALDCTQPQVDGPNNKEGNQAGRDATPRY